MKKQFVFLSILCSLPLFVSGQSAEDIAAAKIMYSIYSMTGGTSNTITESVKSISKIPSTAFIKGAEVETCISGITSQLSARLENYSPNVTFNGKKEDSYFQIKIDGPLSQCPNINDIQFNGDWNYVNNEKNVNILKNDIEKMNKINQDPIEFQKLTYALPIDYKEGDSKPTKVSGSITLIIPTQLKVITLTSKDINKEIAIGETKIKLIELKGNSYKLQWSAENSLIKVVAVNEKDLEFSMNMGRNFPTLYYNEFSKKDNLSDEDFNRIVKSFDQNDKRITRLSRVSGTIHKIYIYYVEKSAMKKVNIDLAVD